MRFYIFLLIAALFCVQADKALSHIEHGGMPDSVAEMEYRILLEFEPQNHEVRVKLGDVLFRLKKFKEAKEEFLSVLSKDSDNLLAQIGLGQLLIHDKNWSEAESTFCELQKKYPDNLDITYFRAVVYKETGRVKEAEEILTDSLNKAQTDQSKEASHTIGKIKEILAAIQSHDDLPDGKTAQ